MPIEKSQLERKFRSFFGRRSFLNFREQKCNFWTSRHLLFEKHIQLFRMCGC